MPPVSSRTIIKSVPRQTEALRGEASTRASEAKKQGRTVGSHLLAQLQQALLRADGAGAPFGTADSAEKDGVGGFSGGKGFICEGGASFVNRAL